MIRLARYLKHFKKEVILGPAFKLIEAIFELLIPLIMASIIDVGIKNSDTDHIWRMGGRMVLLGVIGLLCAIVCQYMASKASQGVGTMIRNDLFAHINALSHAEIDRLGTSSLVNRINNDVNQLQLAVAMLIRLVVRAPFLVIGSAVMAMLLDFQMFLIFLAAGAVVSFIIYLVMKRSIPFYRVIQKKLDRIGLLTLENLSGTRVIRAFSRQKAEEKRFSDANKDHADTAVKVGKIAALLNPLTSVVMNSAIIAIIWFGAIRVDTGSLEQGQIVALVNYITQILLALVVVANLVIIFTKASASAARVNEVFDTAASVTDEGNMPVNAAGSGRPILEMKDVSFAYGHAGEPAVEGISLSLAAGETLGIIGATGSGKSTVINLIPRFYDVTSGQVLIDGVDVKQYPFSELRGQIGIVPQHAALFHGTIEKNMRWSKPDADLGEIEKALCIAQAADFVHALPDGLDTVISQNAKNLSGGQKQRLTIARALTNAPRILILDDSSSALDFATDAALRKALKAQANKMTVIIVSQRANAIRHADKILVLEDGRMAGLGSHETLLISCPVYQEICQSQISKQELEEGGSWS